MLLALWPIFIQHQRNAAFGFIDRGGNKREDDGPIAEDENAGLDRAERASIESAGVGALDIPGHDGGLSASGDAGQSVTSTNKDGAIPGRSKAAMNRDDEVLFLILASL